MPDGDNQQQKNQSGNSGGGEGNQNQQQNQSSEEDAKLKEVIKQRDELKKKLKDLDEAEALKKGEFEKVISAKNTEIETLKQKESELEAVKAERDEIVTATKKELLELLSDEHKKIGEKLSISDLRQYVKLNSKTNPAGMDSGRSGNGVIDTTGKKWTDFTSKELDEIHKNNKPAYERLRKEHFKLK